MLNRLLKLLRPDNTPQAALKLLDWFHVAFDDHAVQLDVSPPGTETWTAEFKWDSVQRVCFQAEGLEASDGIYMFTSDRPESFVIPTEAKGGLDFWNEVIRRGLFNEDLAIAAATAVEGQFWWPAPESQPNQVMQTDGGCAAVGDHTNR